MTVWSCTLLNMSALLCIMIISCAPTQVVSLILLVNWFVWSCTEVVSVAPTDSVGSLLSLSFLWTWRHHVVPSTAPPHVNLRRSLARRSENIWVAWQDTKCTSSSIIVLVGTLNSSQRLWLLKALTLCFHSMLLLSRGVHFCFTGGSNVRWYSETLRHKGFPLYLYTDVWFTDLKTLLNAAFSQSVCEPTTWSGRVFGTLPQVFEFLFMPPVQCW